MSRAATVERRCESATVSLSSTLSGFVDELQQPCELVAPSGCVPDVAMSPSRRSPRADPCRAGAAVTIRLPGPARRHPAGMICVTNPGGWAAERVAVHVSGEATSVDEGGEDAAQHESGTQPGGDVEGIVGAHVDAPDHHEKGEHDLRRKRTSALRMRGRRNDWLKSNHSSIQALRAGATETYQSVTMRPWMR
jgi:hypothetical protein